MTAREHRLGRLAMRLLFFCPCYLPVLAGSEVAAHGWASGLAARGHGVWVVTATESPDRRARRQIDGVQVLHGRLRPDISRYVEAFRPQVLLAQVEMTLPVIEFAGSARLPVAVLCHSPFGFDQVARAGLVPRVDLFVFNSPFLADLAGGCIRHVVSSPPIDLARVTAPAGLERRFVTLVNLNPNKGPHVFYGLARAFPDRRFLGVAGAYGDQVILDRPNVVHRPATMEMGRIYGETRVLLMPSAEESFGMVAVEAQHNGIPVLASDFPSLRGSLGQGATFVPREDLGAWVAALRSLDDPARYAKAAVAARENAARHDPKASVAALEAALAGLLEPRTPRKAAPARPGEQPRVLFFCRWFHPPLGGGELTLGALARALAEAGARVAIWYTAGSPPPASALPGIEVRLARTTERGDPTPEQVVPLALDELRPHVVMTQTQTFRIVCQELLRRGDDTTRVVNYVQYWTQWLREPARLDELLAQGADLEAYALVESLSVTRQRTDLHLGNSVLSQHVLSRLDIRSRCVRPLVNLAAGAALEHTPEGVLFVSVSKYGGLAAAIARLLPDLKVLVPRWEWTTEARAAYAELESLANVRFLHGPLPAAELFRRALVVVNPSQLPESFCRVEVEAMVNGVPTVYADRGHLPMIGAGTGRCVPAAAPAADWAAAVREVLADPDAGDRSRRVLLSVFPDGMDRDTEWFVRAVLDLARGRLPAKVHGLTANFPGVRAAMSHLAVVGGWATHHLETLDSQQLAEAELVVVGGWTPRYQEVLDRAGKPAIVHWHSSLAQMEFSPGEVAAFREALDGVRAGRFRRLWVTDRSTADAVGDPNLVRWMPDTFVPWAVVPRLPGVDLGPRAVALFADGKTPRKNVLAQALAARMAGAEIHANQVLARGTYGQAARELGATVVDHGWVEDKAEVYRRMAGCKAALACHFAETFCYAAAEYLALGVVPLVSLAIKVTVRMTGDLARYLVVPDPTDTTVIAERLRLLLAHDDLRAHLARLGREYILGEALRWNQLAVAQLESEGLR